MDSITLKALQERYVEHQRSRFKLQTAEGNRMHLNTIVRLLGGRRLTPHSLRHMHTAMLAEAGVPLEDISRRLGHADSKITREVYMHVTEKNDPGQQRPVEGCQNR